MRKILIFPAVDNKTVGFKIEFLYKALHGGIQVGKEGGVCRVEVGQSLDLPLGDEKQMNLITGRRMLKRNQVRGLAEAFDWDGETHVGEDPADEEGDKSKTQKFAEHGLLRIT